MLDRDLAVIYQIETRVLNQKVKRNIERFPNSFCFQMNENEFNIWKSQTVMSNSDKLGLRRAPFVFTEQGIAMLSAIINTDIAVKMSIKIMDAFVSMRKYINTNNYNQRISNIETKIIEHDNKFNLILDKLSTKEEKNHSDISLPNIIHVSFLSVHNFIHS